MVKLFILLGIVKKLVKWMNFKPMIVVLFVMLMCIAPATAEINDNLHSIDLGNGPERACVQAGQGHDYGQVRACNFNVENSLPFLEDLNIFDVDLELTGDSNFTFFVNVSDKNGIDSVTMGYFLIESPNGIITAASISSSNVSPCDATVEMEFTLPETAEEGDYTCYVGVMDQEGGMATISDEFEVYRTPEFIVSETGHSTHAGERLNIISNVQNNRAPETDITGIAVDQVIIHGTNEIDYEVPLEGVEITFLEGNSVDTGNNINVSIGMDVPEGTPAGQIEVRIYYPFL